MTFFTTLETVGSILSAAIFGVIFAFLDTVLKLFSTEINHIGKIGEHIFADGGIFRIPKRCKETKAEKGQSSRLFGEIKTFLKVLFFGIGFILLSYYALDGAIRIYLLLFAIGFFFLFRYASDASLFKICDSVFLFVYGSLVILLRLVLRPILAISKIIFKKIIKKREK